MGNPISDTTYGLFRLPFEYRGGNDGELEPHVSVTRVTDEAIHNPPPPFELAWRNIVIGARPKMRWKQTHVVDVAFASPGGLHLAAQLAHLRKITIQAPKLYFHVDDLLGRRQELMKSCFRNSALPFRI